MHQLHLSKMSESPTSHSDPEKNIYSDDKKTVYDADAPVYDEAIGESDVVEFVETKELRYIVS